MKTYQTPRLTTYGPAEALTGVLGSPNSGDVQFDLSGSVTEEGTLSVDACPTEDRQTCFYPEA